MRIASLALLLLVPGLSRAADPFDKGHIGVLLKTVESSSLLQA